ncbi:copper resistance protein C [Methylomarinovum caldicuralii]|uniref:Copper resistance protein C n=1 Tax=Methylomarinovum caldicuralii TaxID=438856 RepID=A0AAU9CPV1_9GAMM|nr:copper resistance CopC family protein [Methylomarinovum caldicuralii]BCX81537.1 copper resistance protein C [Methylomarinovum caldicuralii]
MRALFLAFLMAFAALPATAWAHAVVVRSSLDRQAPVPGRATEVHLFFNSDVEPLLSIVYLVSSGDRKQSLELRHGPKPGELIIALPPLTPGEYALQYKVFAADGHITEDVLKFNVPGE